MGTEARALLAELVAARSPSREEGPAVDVMRAWGAAWPVVRRGLNVAFVREGALPGPTLLLVSHVDTVPAVAGWTRDPWCPTVEAGRLYGLGANDAKGCVAAMAIAFASARVDRGRLVFAPVVEEEVGRGGLEAFLPDLPPPDAAIVGEPTGLDVAVAQSGLLVLDLVRRGRAGHAARPHLADNPIYGMARDVLALEGLVLHRPSACGPTTVAVTVVSAGERHNVIPGEARFTVDFRTTPAYTHAELVAQVRAAVGAEVNVRSDRFHPVATPADAEILACVRAAWPTGQTFVSPTLSDWAHLRGVPAVKWGPGRSEVSHTADEWVELGMIDDAVVAYRAAVERYLERA